MCFFSLYTIILHTCNILIIVVFLATYLLLLDGGPWFFMSFFPPLTTTTSCISYRVCPLNCARMYATVYSHAAIRKAVSSSRAHPHNPHTHTPTHTENKTHTHSHAHMYVCMYMESQQIMWCMWYMNIYQLFMNRLVFEQKHTVLSPLPYLKAMRYLSF